MDCHLLALKQIAIEHGYGVPELFTDESYAISNHFSLSTSQVSEAISILAQKLKLKLEFF